MIIVQLLAKLRRISAMKTEWSTAHTTTDERRYYYIPWEKVLCVEQ